MARVKSQRSVPPVEDHVRRRELRRGIEAVLAYGCNFGAISAESARTYSYRVLRCVLDELPHTGHEWARWTNATGCSPPTTSEGKSAKSARGQRRQVPPLDTLLESLARAALDDEVFHSVTVRSVPAYKQRILSVWRKTHGFTHLEEANLTREEVRAYNVYQKFLQEAYGMQPLELRSAAKKVMCEPVYWLVHRYKTRARRLTLGMLRYEHAWYLGDERFPPGSIGFAVFQILWDWHTDKAARSGDFLEGPDATVRLLALTPKGHVMTAEQTAKTAAKGALSFERWAAFIGTSGPDGEPNIEPDDVEDDTIPGAKIPSE